VVTVTAVSPGLLSVAVKVTLGSFSVTLLVDNATVVVSIVSLINAVAVAPVKLTASKLPPLTPVTVR
jgi:hypothetical protein